MSPFSVTRYTFVNGFIERLRKNRDVSKEEEAHIWESIDRLYDLQSCLSSAEFLTVYSISYKILDQ